MTDYQKQANDFLERNGLHFRAVRSAVQKCPSWSGDTKISGNCGVCRSTHGDCYKVSLSGDQRRITFPFWNSAHAVQTGEPLTAYDVLACISSDAYCPDTFEDFCGEFGYEPDNRKAFALFKRCAAFAEQLRKFFTADELEQLGEIQ